MGANVDRMKKPGEERTLLDVVLAMLNNTGLVGSNRYGTSSLSFGYGGEINDIVFKDARVIESEKLDKLLNYRPSCGELLRLSNERAFYIRRHREYYDALKGENRAINQKRIVIPKKASLGDAQSVELDGGMKISYQLYQEKVLTAGAFSGINLEPKIFLLITIDNPYIMLGENAMYGISASVPFDYNPFYACRFGDLNYEGEQCSSERDSFMQFVFELDFDQDFTVEFEPIDSEHEKRWIFISSKKKGEKLKLCEFTDEAEFLSYSKEHSCVDTGYPSYYSFGIEFMENYVLLLFG